MVKKEDIAAGAIAIAAGIAIGAGAAFLLAMLAKKLAEEEQKRKGGELIG